MRAALAMVLSLLATAASAQRLTSSLDDFTLEQGDGGWFYGFIGGTDAGTLPTYGVDPFQLLDDPSTGRWKASDGLVAPPNNLYLNLAPLGLHPCGIGNPPTDRSIWPVRRYVMPSSGRFSMIYEVASTNAGEARGTGVTGRIFVDGVELRTHPIRDYFSVIVAAPLIMQLDAGAIIDCALDPLGVPPFPLESPYSARADGTEWRIRIYPYPCADDSACGDVSCIVDVCCDPALHLCPDAGQPDAGPPDAGPPDAGPPDAGATDDAGQVDAGNPEPPPPPGVYRAACGCDASGALPLLLLLLTALGLPRSRTARRAHPHRS